MYYKCKIGKMIDKTAGGSKKTRPDTRLPKSHAGGQGPYLRSPDHLGSSGVKKNKIIEKSKM